MPRSRSRSVLSMVQNHLMQVVSLVAMEPPIAFSAENVRDRKHDALASMQPILEDGPGRSDGASNVVRAQYAAGWLAGTEVPGYRQEEGVNPESVTETFVALRLHLDSWRWAGVPFYIRTGKRLPKRTTEIAIQFRKPPLHIFKRVSPTPISSNLLIVNVQPDEGISVRFEAKLPGTRMNAAFLVSREMEQPFDSRVKEIGQQYEKLTFKYTGPWPPYNFVNIRLKLERAH